jgi:hypothetical protein
MARPGELHLAEADGLPVRPEECVPLVAISLALDEAEAE